MFVIVSVICCVVLVRFVLLFFLGVVGSYCVAVVVSVLCWLVTACVHHAGSYVVVPNDAAVYHLFVRAGMDQLGSCIYRFFLVVLVSRSCSSSASSRRPVLFAPSCPVLPRKLPLANHERRLLLQLRRKPINGRLLLQRLRNTSLSRSALFTQSTSFIG